MKKCAICGLYVGQYGHNPEPILPYDERVCDICNDMHVLPVRMGAKQTITTYNSRTLVCGPK